MEDVLKRMLAVEALGEEEIEKAERQAQEIRDSMNDRIAEERSAFEGDLRRQCEEMVSEEVEAASKAAEASLSSLDAELGRNEEQTRKKLSVISDDLLKELAFPGQGREMA